MIGLLTLAKKASLAEAGNNLTQQFKSLAGKVGCQDRQAGDVAARPRKAGDDAGGNRVAHDRGHDRDDRCRLFCRNNRWCGIRDDDVHLEPDKLGRDLGEALTAALRPAIFDREIAALDPAEFVQPLHESGNP